jgi:plasmid stabilization system protein ParE
MRVVYTTEALADLDGIFDYIVNPITPPFPMRSKIGFTRSLRASPDGQRAHKKFPSGRAFVSHR